MAATLQGFPPSNLISPSVRISESSNLSFSTGTQNGGTIAGIVGFASKGPVNIPTLITSLQQLTTVFGNPHPDVGDPYLIYAASQVLQVSNQVFIVRVADTNPVSSESAVAASTTVLTAGGPVQVIGNVAVSSGGWIVPSPGLFFAFRLNGVLSSKILVLMPGTYTVSGANTIAGMLIQLNDQLSSVYDGIQFFLSGSGNSQLLGVETTFSYGPGASIELVSVLNSMYGPSSIFGLGTGMTQAVVAGSLIQYPATSVPNSGHYDFSSFTAGTLNLQVVVDGTGNVNIDNIVQTITINSTVQTISTIVTAINNQISLGCSPCGSGTIPGGFIASSSSGSLVLTTSACGNDSAIVVKSASTADALFGLDNNTHYGHSGVPCVSIPGATYACGIVTGSVNNNGTQCFTITADSVGIDGNATSVVITNDTASATFVMQVYSYGSQVEAWGGLTKNPLSSYYVESYLALVSDYIRVIDNINTLALPAPSTTSSPYVLSGGTDGLPADPNNQDTTLLGSSAAMSGLQALSDSEQVNIDLITIPGHSSTGVVEGLINFATARGDCFAILDSPFGLTASEIVAWQNGVHPLNSDLLDSDFAALYWPWVQIRDSFNSINVWVPPSSVIMGVYVHSDSLVGPWAAPAGANRGLCPGVLDVFTRPTRADRDNMYSTNAVNPIISFTDLNGFYAWGQKTLQRTPSAVDHVSVRRMLLYVEKRLQSLTRSIQFEPNNPALWTQFTSIANNFLSGLLTQNAIQGYMVTCDSTTNTTTTIQNNQLVANIGIQPLDIAEFIFINFAAFNAGNFNEALQF